MRYKNIINLVQAPQFLCLAQQLAGEVERLVVMALAEQVVRHKVARVDILAKEHNLAMERTLAVAEEHSLAVAMEHKPAKEDILESSQVVVDKFAKATKSTKEHGLIQDWPLGLKTGWQ